MDFMKIDWKILVFALLITCIMTLCAIIEQYWSFGDEVFTGMATPIGVLSWGGSFLLVSLFWFIVLDFITRHTKRKIKS